MFLLIHLELAYLGVQGKGVEEHRTDEGDVGRLAAKSVIIIKTALPFIFFIQALKLIKVMIILLDLFVFVSHFDYEDCASWKE